MSSIDFSAKYLAGKIHCKHSCRIFQSLGKLRDWNISSQISDGLKKQTPLWYKVYNLCASWHPCSHPRPSWLPGSPPASGQTTACYSKATCAQQFQRGCCGKLLLRTHVWSLSSGSQLDYHHSFNSILFTFGSQALNVPSRRPWINFSFMFLKCIQSTDLWNQLPKIPSSFLFFCPIVILPLSVHLMCISL